MRQEDWESEVSLETLPQEKNMRVCWYIPVYACLYVYVFMYVPMYVCLYIYLCMCVYVYVCSDCTYVHRKYKDVDTHMIISQFSYIIYFHINYFSWNFYLEYVTYLTYIKVLFVHNILSDTQFSYRTFCCSC